MLIPSFLIYLISMVGETNRAPFDLPEAEGELVGGFHTEYSSMRFAMFFMAEYMNMITVSALAATLVPRRLPRAAAVQPDPGPGQGYWGVLWFLLKVLSMLFLFVWLRGTLPRLRYDQFMRFGWRYLIPISLVWIVMVAAASGSATARAGSRPRLLGRRRGGPRRAARPDLLRRQGGDAPRRPERRRAFDAFAGGYPVPPQGDQQLPELAGVVSATRGSQDPHRHGARTPCPPTDARRAETREEES